MQDLRVIGVENGALLVASDDGTRYRIAIDEVLQSKLRKSIPDPGAGRKLAPKEIQAHIRSGMSAQDVASITGVPLEYIQKFEGPVLAEREFVVESALGVPVHTALESDPMSQGTTFGAAIRERLYDLGAINERWASWKEIGGGWIVKLAFTADQIDHDARWRYDPKKAALAPLNNEAITLSQQGELSGALIPRLRAVGGEERVPDSTRFDSGAFSQDELTEQAGGPRGEITPFSRAETSSPAVSAAAINREPADEAARSNETADLLEALRRRRGERETANFDDDQATSVHPSAGGIRLIDVPLEGYTDSEPSDEDDDDVPGHTAPQPAMLQSRSRKGRAAMPSWDDIVFGARPDDEA
ncbi:MAG TPA: septation protein SepH [Lacisediminihabitans sp.]|nr:septation protein SepH [Lacisediminihabitans sp.]HXD61279.1 septation protein SepH [Lacisediminihabitans sp.]